MSDDIEVNPFFLGIGVLAGGIASLWTILPFFIPGLVNLLGVTLAAGGGVLLLMTALKKKALLHAGGVAVAVFLLVSFLLVPAASTVFFPVEKVDLQVVQAVEGTRTLNLSLPGLFCQGCAYSAQSALQGVPGVKAASVDFDSKAGVVVFDPAQVSEDTILSNQVIQAYGGEPAS